MLRSGRLQNNEENIPWRAGKDPEKEVAGSAKSSRRAFKEVSNKDSRSTLDSMKLEGKDGKAKDAQRKGRSHTRDQQTNTEKSEVNVNSGCQKCAREKLENNPGEIEKLLTSESLCEDDSVNYWKEVCEQTRAALVDSIEEKEALRDSLGREARKNAKLAGRVLVLEAKLEVMKEFLAEKLQCDIHFDSSDDDNS